MGDTCICGKIILKQNYNRHCKSVHHKEYLQKNGIQEEEPKLVTPIYTRNAHKAYYTRNRDKLLEKCTIKCECGSEISRSNMNHHKKSKIHASKMLAILN